jgi:hypothetical protein
VIRAISGFFGFSREIQRGIPESANELSLNRVAFIEVFFPTDKQVVHKVKSVTEEMACWYK